MKRISTLFSLLVFAAASNAQTINETFENYSSLSELTNNCCSFSGVGLSTTTGITGTKSLVIIPTTSAGGSGNSNIAQIITPFNASASSPAKVNLYNMAGVKVYSFNIAIQKGTNTIVEPVDNRIAKGTYILEVSSTTQRRPVKVTK